MGGLGSGGSRINSGPAGKSAKLRWLGGKAGHKPIRPDTALPTNAGEAPEPPADMPEAQAEYWKLWAPLAAGRGMLDEVRAPGFAVLCRTAARAAELWERIQADGLTYPKVTVDSSGQEHMELKAHSLLSHYRALEHRQEQLMARYGLAADGKIQAGKTSEDEEEADIARILAVK